MYKPECFFHPGATYSPYYACTTYYDHGGVHLNSGVFNHLFAVLVDGGEFVNGASVTTIAPLGLVKTLNLYWRTHEEMTSAAVFYDFAMTINEVCSLNIGETLYYPNVFNSTISEAGSLSAADCLLVSAAVTASGMDSTAEVCPNLDCSWDECMWAMCPAAESGNYEVFYEVRLAVHTKDLLGYTVYMQLFFNNLGGIVAEADFILFSAQHLCVLISTCCIARGAGLLLLHGGARRHGQQRLNQATLRRHRAQLLREVSVVQPDEIHERLASLVW